MDEKYLKDFINGYLNSGQKYGDYLIYGDDLPKNDYVSDYGDMYKQIITYEKNKK